MPTPITLEELAPVIRTLSKMFLQAFVEAQVAQVALVATKLVTPADLEAARQGIQQNSKSTLDSLERATPEALLEMIRKYQGPVQ
jgi:hypothetical protein